MELSIGDVELTERESEMLRFCLNYYKQFKHVGVPGHTLFMLVGKIAEAMDAAGFEILEPEIDMTDVLDDIEAQNA